MASRRLGNRLPGTPSFSLEELGVRIISALAKEFTAVQLRLLRRSRQAPMPAFDRRKWQALTRAHAPEPTVKSIQGTVSTSCHFLLHLDQAALRPGSSICS